MPYVEYCLCRCGRGMDAMPMAARDMMSMQEAVTIAHTRLFHRAIQASEEAMDIIATTLSRHVVVYGVRAGTAERHTITPKELEAGLFRAAGSRFEFRNAEVSITQLAVRRSDLERILQMLA